MRYWLAIVTTSGSEIKKEVIYFGRAKKTMEIKKVKRGKIPQRHRVTKQEIIEFLKNKYNTEITGSKEEE